MVYISQKYKIMHLKSISMNNKWVNLSTRLQGCKLNRMSCETVKRCLQSTNSLIHLDLSCNPLGDSGARVLSGGITSPHCKLQTLRLVDCNLLNPSVVWALVMYQCQQETLIVYHSSHAQKLTCFSLVKILGLICRSTSLYFKLSVRDGVSANSLTDMSYSILKALLPCMLEGTDLLKPTINICDWDMGAKKRELIFWHKNYYILPDIRIIMSGRGETHPCLYFKWGWPLQLPFIDHKTASVCIPIKYSMLKRITVSWLGSTVDL